MRLYELSSPMRTSWADDGAAPSASPATAAMTTMAPARQPFPTTLAYMLQLLLRCGCAAVAASWRSDMSPAATRSFAGERYHAAAPQQGRSECRAQVSRFRSSPRLAAAV